jgi:hypothetical protein
MRLADRVYQHLKQLPESVAVEVLDFVQFLECKQQANRASATPAGQCARPGLDRRRLRCAAGLQGRLVILTEGMSDVRHRPA